MERFNTEVENVVVEIDGEEYPVAYKTVAVADQLIAAGKKYGDKPMYQLWLAELEILLGKQACKHLFASGSAENIDRIQRIHAGVLRAFDYHAGQIAAEDSARRNESMAELVHNLAPLNELLRRLQRLQPETDLPVVRRS